MSVAGLLTEVSRKRKALLILAALLLGAAPALPLWGMTLVSTQYPEGLRLVVYPARIAGDVNEINALNHYIGMTPISADFFTELRYLQPALFLLAGDPGDRRDISELQVVDPGRARQHGRARRRRPRPDAVPSLAVRAPARSPGGDHHRSVYATHGRAESDCPVRHLQLLQLGVLPARGGGAAGDARAPRRPATRADAVYPNLLAAA